MYAQHGPATLIIRLVNVEWVMAQTLGEVVRELREAKNLSQAQLAERADVAVSYVVALEAGRAGRMTSSILVRVAKALDVPAKRLADTEAL